MPCFASSTLRGGGGSRWSQRSGPTGFAYRANHGLPAYFSAPFPPRFSPAVNQQAPTSSVLVADSMPCHFTRCPLQACTDATERSGAFLRVRGVLMSISLGSRSRYTRVPGLLLEPAGGAPYSHIQRSKPILPPFSSVYGYPPYRVPLGASVLSTAPSTCAPRRTLPPSV